MLLAVTAREKARLLHRLHNSLHLVHRLRSLRKNSDAGDGLISRDELEAKFGRITDKEWNKYDHDKDGTVSLDEWNNSKTAIAAKQTGRSEKEMMNLAEGFLQIDDSGDGIISREEFEEKFGKLSDDEWRQFDEDGDGTITLKEWQHSKMERVQKGVLLLRSAFEHCVQRELSKAGFDMSRIAIYTVVALFTVVIVLGIAYFAMKTANAMGAMSAMLSSGMSAIGIAVFNMPKKKDKMDPKISKAIVKLNVALQTTLHDAIIDICDMLFFYPALHKIIAKGIDDAEAHLMESNSAKDASLQKNATEMIKVAKSAFKQGLKSCAFK